MTVSKARRADRHGLRFFRRLNEVDDTVRAENPRRNSKPRGRSPRSRTRIDDAVELLKSLDEEERSRNPRKAAAIRARRARGVAPALSRKHFRRPPGCDRFIAVPPNSGPVGETIDYHARHARFLLDRFRDLMLSCTRNTGKGRCRWTWLLRRAGRLPLSTLIDEGTAASRS